MKINTGSKFKFVTVTTIGMFVISHLVSHIFPRHHLLNFLVFWLIGGIFISFMIGLLEGDKGGL